jgi:geranylgeranyl diphosphate synthase type I
MFSDLNTFFEFIKKEKGISSKSKICITGGASTPVYLIDEYISFLEFYLDYKEKISLFNNSIEALNASFLSSKEEKDVFDAIGKFISLNSGGKYVRAYLIDLGYRVFGKKKNYAIPLSLAYEFFQTAILIHDDIIDNAKERRGKKTIPVLYNEEFLKFSSELTKCMQTSNSLALCIGDLGYYYANKIILDNYEHDKNLAKVFKYYNDIVINTIKGEIMDVILPFKEQFIKVNPNLDDILKIFKLKTSLYSVVGPFCLGMALAGKSAEEIKLYEQILVPVGIAFQIKDDLLGVYSDNSIVGKDSSDISEYKQTLLYYYTVKQDKYRGELLKYYGKLNLEKNDIDSVRKIFDDSGAKSFAIEMMNTLFNKARRDVLKLDISDRYKKILLGFILYLEYRDK